MTKFKIGDIVKGGDGDKYVFGYVLKQPYKVLGEPYVIVRWFDGYPDTDSRCKMLREVTNLEDIDRIEDW